MIGELRQYSVVAGMVACLVAMASTSHRGGIGRKKIDLISKLDPGNRAWDSVVASSCHGLGEIENSDSL